MWLLQIKLNNCDYFHDNNVLKNIYNADMPSSLQQNLV